MSRALVLSFFLVSCLSRPTGGAKAQEVAQDFNLNTRFGRMEIAMESVAPEARTAFAKSRSFWGNRIRIADSELAGVRVTNEKSTEADVMVRVAWYRVDEQEMRTTTLRQHWKDGSNGWVLASEERIDGEIGLFGEPVVRVQPTDPVTERPQFPTVRLTGGVSE